MIDLHGLQSALAFDPLWAAQFEDAWRRASARIHLAVFVEPYLQYVLDGTKTVESRFSVNATAPYGRVNEGDVLLLKRSGGPIVGICRAANVWEYQLDAKAWRHIRRRFARALRVDDSDFLERKAHTSFATLILLAQVCEIPPIACVKRDRRGWVVLRDREAQPTLFSCSLPA